MWYVTAGRNSTNTNIILIFTDIGKRKPVGLKKNCNKSPGSDGFTYDNRTEEFN